MPSLASIIKSAGALQPWSLKSSAAADAIFWVKTKEMKPHDQKNRRVFAKTDCTEALVPEEASSSESSTAASAAAAIFLFRRCRQPPPSSFPEARFPMTGQQLWWDWCTNVLSPNTAKHSKQFLHAWFHYKVDFYVPCESILHKFGTSTKISFEHTS